MAARIDFDYLHRLAHDAESHATLTRIQADRERLLSGASLDTPGEWLSLTLALGPEEIGTVHLCLRSDRAPASMDTVLEIFRDHAHAVLPGFSGELGGTVVDLGANEGYYALRLKLLNPTIQVLAAEPVSENAEGFRANMAANGIDDVTLCETAITHHNGTTRIETLPHVGTVASTNMLAFPRPWIRPDEIRSRTVPTMTLDDLLENHAVTTAEILKVDVEGSEVDILSTGGAALRRFRRVVVECHGAAARQATRTIMESEGFATLHVEPKRSGDLYFLRQ